MGCECAVCLGGDYIMNKRDQYVWESLEIFSPKITKGYWRLVEYRDGALVDVEIPVDDKNVTLCTLAKPTDNAVENSKAIAAVPELLEVYKTLLTYINKKHSNCVVLQVYYEKLLDSIENLEEKHNEYKITIYD